MDFTEFFRNCFQNFLLMLFRHLFHGMKFILGRRAREKGDLLMDLNHFTGDLPMDLNHFTGHLPMDLVSEILFRCPVASIIDFKLVCKSWKAHICSRDFESGYYSHNRADGNLLYFEDNMFVAMVSVYNKSLNNRKHIASFRPALFLAAYCRGLIALQSAYMDTYRLWNPCLGNGFIEAKIAIDEYINADMVSRLFRDYEFRRRTGLFYSSSTNEYKLVIFVDCEGRDYIHFFILNFNSGEHKLLIQYGLSIGQPTQNDGVVVNDCPHWATSKQIYAFDPEEEEFVLITTPRGCIGSIIGIGALQGMLTVAAEVNCGADLEIWKLTTYDDPTTWSILCTIPNPKVGALRLLALLTNPKLFIGMTGYDKTYCL